MAAPRPAFLAAVLAVATALAGCIGGGAPGPAPLSPSSSEAAQALASGLSVEAKDCQEGGGHSVYNMEYLGWEFDILPEPWVPADVAADLDNPKLDSNEFPVMGPVTGIYHTTVVCESWSYAGEERSDLVFGFVGIRVEPPPFDPGGATRHYLLDVFTMGDEGVHHALHDLGYHATLGSGLIEYVTPLGLFHQVLEDEEHGVYETHVEMREVGPMEAGTTRLWLTLKGDDDLFHPVAIDLVNAPGGTHVANPGEGVFTHLETEDHAFVGGLPPGAGGRIAAMGYVGFDRVLTLGPKVDAALEEGWEH